MRTDRGWWLILLLMAAWVWPSAAEAVTTNIWTLTTRDDFAAGKAETATISTAGNLELGMPLTEIGGITADCIWRVAPGAGRAANELWLTTGGPAGGVFRVRDGRAEAVVQDQDEQFYALAVARDGTVYAGSFPGGTIFKIANGEAKKWVELPDKYVWDLAVDANGVVYAATGLHGKVYRIGADGVAKELFAAANPHLLTLLLHHGTVYAGSSTQGLVYAIAPDGTVRVVADLPQEEVTALTVDASGIVYLAANAGAGGRAPSFPTPRQPRRPSPRDEGDQPDTEAVVAELLANLMNPGDAEGERGEAGPGPARGGDEEPPELMEGPGRRGGDEEGPRGGGSRPGVLDQFKGVPAVYRLTPDGRITLLYATDQDGIFDLLPGSDSSIWIATGSEGKVFKMTLLDEIETQLFDFDARQVLALVRDGNGRAIIATANGGHLYAAGTGTAREGRYTSKPFDAGFPATWGRLHLVADLPARAGVEFRARSGGTSVPDTTWSAWTGFAASPARLGAPDNRYLQVELKLTSADGSAGPRVRELTAAYRVQNQEPLIFALTADGEERDGDGNDRSNGGAGTRRDEVDAPSNAVMRDLGWEATDPDGDKLVYNVWFRGENETAWKWLNAEKPDLTAARFVWNTAFLPDGNYYLKLTADDRRDNPPGRNLTATKLSGPYAIDHSLPEFTGVTATVAGGEARVTAAARDAGNFIAACAYAVDAREWLTLYPEDGLYDDFQERFAFTVPGLDPGEHILTLRVRDRAGNVGLAKTVVTVAP